MPLPRTTERPVRERGDECSKLPARAAPKSYGRESWYGVYRQRIPLDGDRVLCALGERPRMRMARRGVTGSIKVLNFELVKDIDLGPFELRAL